MSLNALTLLLLALVAAALLLLRQRWATLPGRARRVLLVTAVSAMLLFAVGRAASWMTTSDRVNCGFYWAAITGYLLLLTVLSLNHPRWIASLSALILAIPIFGATLFLPLGSIFHPPPRRIQPLADHLYTSLQEFTERGTLNSGVDLEILYRPPLLPFLQHGRLAGRFYNLQCNAAATTVLLEPDHQTVLVRCPLWSAPALGSGQTDTGNLIHLRR